LASAAIDPVELDVCLVGRTAVVCIRHLLSSIGHDRLESGVEPGSKVVGFLVGNQLSSSFCDEWYLGGILARWVAIFAGLAAQDIELVVLEDLL
jgi:hypothetical protein